MAQLDKCDGCGKLSPDGNDLYIANNWFRVKVLDKKRRGYREDDYLWDDYIICRECFGLKEKQSVWSWLARIVGGNYRYPKDKEAAKAE